MKHKIFVYGTLRQGQYNYDIYLKNNATFLNFGFIQGELYEIKGKVYPAFLPEGNHMIIGEIYEVDEEVLRKVDAMEECIDEDETKNEYIKKNCSIYNDQGQVIDDLPVYVYNMNNPMNVPRLGNVIECRDYVQHILKKS